MPDMRQAITWNNCGLVNWHLYTPLGLIKIYDKTIVPVFYMKVVGDTAPYVARASHIYYLL